MNLNSLKAMAGWGAVGIAAAAAYIYKVRPWHLRWGATDEEVAAALPGDEIRPDAGLQVTHAVTIDAPANVVWKWLVQIGQDRGGFYSYDWIENLFGLRVHNTYGVHSDWQQLAVGDFVRAAPAGWLGGKYRDLTGWRVVELEPDYKLVLRDEIEQGSWAFVLRHLDETRTRLVIRARGEAPASLLRKALHYGFLEPAHFVMERKMLLTLKRRAEEFSVEHTEETELDLTAEKIAV